MELEQDKYDLLNTKLLVLHKEILTLNKDQIDEFKVSLCLLRDLIGIYDDGLNNRLKDLTNQVNADIASDVKKTNMSAIKNEALAILSKFFFELKPED